MLKELTAEPNIHEKKPVYSHFFFFFHLNSAEYLIKDIQERSRDSAFMGQMIVPCFMMLDLALDSLFTSYTELWKSEQDKADFRALPLHQQYEFLLRKYGLSQTQKFQDHTLFLKAFHEDKLLILNPCETSLYLAFPNQEKHHSLEEMYPQRDYADELLCHLLPRLSSTLSKIYGSIAAFDQAYVLAHSEKMVKDIYDTLNEYSPYDEHLHYPQGSSVFHVAVENGKVEHVLYSQQANMQLADAVKDYFWREPFSYAMSLLKHDPNAIPKSQVIQCEKAKLIIHIDYYRNFNSHELAGFTSESLEMLKNHFLTCLATKM